MADGRRFCSSQLQAVLAVDANHDDLIYDATIVVSELLTNALNAGCRSARVSLLLHRDVLRVAVDDDAPGEPRQRTPRHDEAHGRGVAIVAALATAWAVEPRSPGKQVWAELDVPIELTADLPSCHQPTRFTLDLPVTPPPQPINLDPTDPADDAPQSYEAAP